MAKSSYTKQFKPGTMPIQPTDPNSPLNQSKVSAAPKTKVKRGK